MVFNYDQASYNTQSAREVVPFIMELLTPSSVLDVGCGIGTWLKVFSAYPGVTKLIGIDGECLQEQQLLIPQEWFIPVDLNRNFDLKDKYDIVISLEVGEHLEEGAADGYVESLTRHADVIIFSAAIPYQNGHGHINLQWPEYWRKKFEQQQFDVYDVFRERFWENENIKWWYKQNMFLYVKKGFMKERFNKSEQKLLAFIHPELLQNKAEQLENITIKTALSRIIKALKLKVFK